MCDMTDSYTYECHTDEIMEVLEMFKHLHFYTDVMYMCVYICMYLCVFIHTCTCSKTRMRLLKLKPSFQLHIGPSLGHDEVEEASANAELHSKIIAAHKFRCC